MPVSRSHRIVAFAAFAILSAGMLTACNSAVVGRRCTGGVAHDSRSVLVCKRGRWARSISLKQAALLFAVAAQRAPGSVAIPTLAVQPVVIGLDHPWEIAFTPDATMLVTERSGSVDAVIDGTPRVLAHPADVQVLAESGMLGLAVDPGFASNRRIYSCFRSTISGAPDVRVARWTVDAGYTTLSNRSDIVTGIPASTSGIHAGCRLKFGPDGQLWIGTGDAATGTVPQDPMSLGGKVLRVTTDGAPSVGNPGGALDPRIYNLGHRNVQGLAFRFADGAAFNIEHGPDADDEVNKLVAGGNYGWDPVPLAGGTTYDQSRPMTDPRVAGAIPATWSSGTPTIAPSGATFLLGGQWKAWNGALAISVLKGSQLRVMQINAAGTAVTAQWTAVTDQGRLRTAVEGPDGNLYLATDADPGQILRVTPS